MKGFKLTAAPFNFGVFIVCLFYGEWAILVFSLIFSSILLITKQMEVL